MEHLPLIPHLGYVTLHAKFTILHSVTILLINVQAYALTHTLLIIVLIYALLIVQKLLIIMEITIPGLVSKIVLLELDGSLMQIAPVNNVSLNAL